MVQISINQLRKQDIDFNNVHEPQEEAFEISLSFQPNSHGNHHFFLWVNGQLSASFITISSLLRRATPIIEAHNLEQVSR